MDRRFGIARQRPRHAPWWKDDAACTSPLFQESGDQSPQSERALLASGRGTASARLWRVAVMWAMLLAAVDAAATAATLPKIRVDRQRRGFVDAAGRAFVPFGVNYYRPGTGWAPQLWKQFDAEATRRDFARLKKQGANVVRVFITFGSFYTEPGRLDRRGIGQVRPAARLGRRGGAVRSPHRTRRLGRTCRRGPARRTSSATTPTSGSEGAGGLSGGCSSRGTAAAARSGPTTCATSRASLGRRLTCAAQWDAWRKSHQQEPAPVPDPKASPASPQLADYQRFRESIAEKWVARQSPAIHAADPEALVTVGLLQWSVPAQRIGLDQYTAFRPSAIARHLDFMELHFYPLASRRVSLRERGRRDGQSGGAGGDGAASAPSRACRW